MSTTGNTFRRVRIIADATCEHTAFGETKRTTLSAGTVLGNVCGHLDGIDVVERHDGYHLWMWTADVGAQSWTGIDPDAVELIS